MAGKDLPNISEVREFRLRQLSAQFDCLRLGKMWQVDETFQPLPSKESRFYKVLFLAVMQSLEMEYRARRGETPDSSDLPRMNNTFLTLRSLGLQSANSRLSIIYGWLSLAYGKLIFNSGNYESARLSILQALQSVYRPDPGDRAELLLYYAESTLEDGLIELTASILERVNNSVLHPIFRIEFNFLRQRVLTLKNALQSTEELDDYLREWAATAGRMRIGRLVNSTIKTGNHLALVSLACKSASADDAILACLKIFAVESRTLMMQLPSVRSLKSRHFQAHSGSRRTAGSLKALELMEFLYERTISISERVRRLGTSSNINLKQLPIESRMLTLAAISRFARRHGQSDLAIDAEQSYRLLSLCASAGVSEDIMAVKLRDSEKTQELTNNRILGVVKFVSATTLKVGTAHVRSIVTNESNRQAILDQQWQQIGENLFDLLSSYRGGLMKLGQVLSLVPNLPERLRLMLQALRYEAKPTKFEDLDRVIDRDLPMQIRKRLTIQELPLAVGSIAQIHRGWFDEHEVAVKIKHPDIDLAVRKDLKMLSLFKPLISLALPRARIHEILEELTSLLLSETDFEKEARTQSILHDAYRDSPDCIVPSVFPESRGDVLIMQYCEGENFAKFCQNSTQEERNEAGRKIAGFVLRSLFRLGIFNGDPHPGNFLFRKDRKVSFLDFGFSRKFDSNELKLWTAILQTTINEDRDGFLRVINQLGIIGDLSKFDTDEHWRLNCHVFKPFITTESFQFSDQFVADVIAKHFSGKNGRYISPPPSSLVLYRIVFGLYGLLAELKAEGCWRELCLEMIESPDPNPF